MIMSTSLTKKSQEKPTHQTVLSPCTCSEDGDMNGRGHSFGCPSIQDVLSRRAQREKESDPRLYGLDSDLNNYDADDMR